MAQAAQLACWGWLGGAALWATRRRKISARATRLTALVLLAACMATTITLTILDNKDLLRTLLPLHLCSLSAFLTLYLLATGNTACFHFCWYLGMPGAALALIFPAVEPSSWPNLMNTAFMLTHALVAFAPLLLWAQGRKPSPQAAGGVLLAGGAFFALTFFVNNLIHANYMFLLKAPPGTPLAWMESLGRAGYFACLAFFTVLTVWVMRAFAHMTNGKWKVESGK
ncbi:MAG: TIGR02206 family membrane protein [Clostridia bacterium]|nr:TIGR02206 family membrane protein [Clostridia bacterium]